MEVLKIAEKRIETKIKSNKPHFLKQVYIDKILNSLTILRDSHAGYFSKRNRLIKKFAENLEKLTNSWYSKE